MYFVQRRGQDAADNVRDRLRIGALYYFPGRIHFCVKHSHQTGGHDPYFHFRPGVVWSAVLIISAMKAVHQYTMPKTILAIIFTVVAMVIIVLVLILLISLFQQIVMFVYSIYTELMYRFNMS